MPLSETQEILEDLIAAAGDAEGPPPDPEGGIPLQKVPGWIRWPIRVAFLPWVLFDLMIQKVARILIRPPFRQTGHCLKRGNCCHYILIPKAKGLLNWINLLWNTEFHGFYFRDRNVYESEGKPMYVMGCRYLKKDGTCGHYHLRPAVCRKWPMIEYFGYPRLLKGCGFKPVLRQSQTSRLNILK
ncbi:MAG TPA: hypothetical protein VLG49_07335 [Rhabdochlamydiaceae bacterium]|nr:hypothetical protein [Rhabdochlamydiaceae bacterium]